MQVTVWHRPFGSMLGLSLEHNAWPLKVGKMLVYICIIYYTSKLYHTSPHTAVVQVGISPVRCWTSFFSVVSCYDGSTL